MKKHNSQKQDRNELRMQQKSIPSSKNDIEKKNTKKNKLLKKRNGKKLFYAADRLMYSKLLTGMVGFRNRFAHTFFSFIYFYMVKQPHIQIVVRFPFFVSISFDVHEMC